MNFKTLKQLSQNLTLLYVEDDQILREKTFVIFKNLFDVVDIAIDGIDALEQYETYYNKNSKHYDIIISDIQMPRLNGIALTKEIFYINKNQKVIVISAYDDKEYLIDLINIGVEAFMQKPLSSINMLKVLYEVCNSFNQEHLIIINDKYTYDSVLEALFCNDEKIDLSDNELNLLQLLIKNKNQSFSSIEIFNHIYFNEPEKEFSSDSIKSLIKRLRKKLPNNLILNSQKLGYSINYTS